MLSKAWWLLLIPMGFFITGFFDWRWAVVGLVLLMLVYPFAVTMALLSHALRPEVIRRVASQRASFDGNTITIYKAIEECGDESETIEYEPIETATVDQSLPMGKLTKVVVGRRPYDFILIPSAALSAAPDEPRIPAISE